MWHFQFFSFCIDQLSVLQLFIDKNSPICFWFYSYMLVLLKSMVNGTRGYGFDLCY